MAVKMAKSGFNLAEVLMAMAFLGIIAAVTIPSVTSTTSNKQALFKAKNIAGQIQLAAQKFYSNDPNTNPSGEEIADLMKYTLKITDGSESVTDWGGTPTTCTAARPCYRFADGGILMINHPVSLNEFYTYDPDHTGPVESVILRLNYGTFAMTTNDAFGNCATSLDPNYVRPWTRCP